MPADTPSVDEQDHLQKAEFLKTRDYKNLLNLLNHSFPGAKPMNKTWRHLYSVPENITKTGIALKEKEKLISHVGLFPLSALVNGSTVKICGIGGVCTHEKYRNRGCMKTLLAYAIEVMRKQKYDISWLSGDRNRYGYFDWENGGRQYRFFLADRSFGNVDADILKVKKYNGERKFLKQIIAIHEKEDFRVKRTEDGYRRLLRRMNKTTYLAFDAGKPVSYITLDRSRENPETGTIFEYGGDPESVKSLLKYFFTNLGIKGVHIYSPVIRTSYTDMLFQCCAGWSMDCTGMIKIINLKSLLSKFQRQMSEKIQDTTTGNCEITLIMKDTGQTATLCIHKNVKVVNGVSSRKLCLSDRDMVRLLFGLSKPSDIFPIKKKYSELDSVFPLDFYIWPLETV